MHADDRPTAAAIIEAYRRATPTDILEGRRWYPRAGDMIAALAEWAGVDPATMAATVAALSPRNPWAWNVADAATFARAAAAGAPMPVASTFGANRERAWSILHDRGSWLGSALKVRAFVRAMTGDEDSVVVDVWAIRVATRGRRDSVANDADYALAATAYREAARIIGESPRDLQAIVWLVGQREGMGSRRAGRIDKALKRGTPPIVAEWLTGQLALAL